MKSTVLVVDDMPIIRDPIAATLVAAGYEAHCAGNGKQALEQLRGQQVDLILLDVNMPVMDGLSFLRILRGDSSTAEIPVIMLSGAEDREDILQAAKLGIRGYVLKSNFSLKDLLTRVTKHFDGLTPATASRQPTSPSAPDATKADAKPTAAAPSQSGASPTPGKIPSLIGAINA